MRTRRLERSALGLMVLALAVGFAKDLPARRPASAPAPAPLLANATPPAGPLLMPTASQSFMNMMYGAYR